MRARRSGAGGRRGASYAVLGPALAVGLLLAGCSGDRDPAAPVGSGPSVSGTPSPVGTASPAGTATATGSASASASESAPPGGPAPTRPATSAGSLVQASLPAPATLGPGWEHHVDGGDVEGNYIGNGTPAQSRDPDELVSALVPPGCAVESVYDVALPRPAYVLEVAYAHPAGVQGIGLGLEFGSQDQARAFVGAYAGALADCTPAAGAPEGAVDVTVLTPPSGAAALTRIEDSVEQTTWTELVARRGAVVTILGVDTASGPALPRWPVVASAL